MKAGFLISEIMLNSLLTMETHLTDNFALKPMKFIFANNTLRHELVSS